MNHLTDAVEKALSSANYYAALIVALALPDICGWIQNPKTRSKKRYIEFFETMMIAHYLVEVRPGVLFPLLNGDDFYALRCAMLHQGTDDITSQDARKVLEKFIFVQSSDGSTNHANRVNNKLQLQPDIFCREILAGVYQFLSEIVPGSEQDERMKSLINIETSLELRA